MSPTEILQQDSQRLGHPGQSLFYMLGDTLRKGWNSAPAMVARGGTKHVFDSGPAAGALGGGAAGAALGYGVGKALDWNSDDEGWRGRLGAVLGGLAGAGLGAYVGHKRASNGLADIQAALSSDSSVSGAEKSTMMQAIQALNPGDIQLLAQLVRTAAGAGVGVLIAKFLFKAGLGGMMLGALGGGFAGASTLAGPSSSGKKDLFGNPYRL